MTTVAQLAAIAAKRKPKGKRLTRAQQRAIYAPRGPAVVVTEEKLERARAMVRERQPDLFKR